MQSNCKCEKQGKPLNQNEEQSNLMRKRNNVTAVLGDHDCACDE